MDELKHRLPHILTANGPLLVELHTTLADKTPMTAGMGVPFAKQVETLRDKLLAADAAR